jgi:hypothetical protein
MSELTRSEQEKGAKVIRRWHKDDIEFVVALPARERNLIVLAAALLDISPGQPLDPNPLEL